MPTTYRPCSPADQRAVAAMMLQLYQEDPSSLPMTPEKVQRTFEVLRQHPDYGYILVMEYEGTVAGYALLVNFWSSEYGGIILNIDELYVQPAHRSTGLGSGLIRHLMAAPPANVVALQLEVTAGNGKARKLYERLGFKPHKNEKLTHEGPFG